MNSNGSSIGPHKDIVISSRIRIARNVDPFSFPHLLNLTESTELLDEIVKAVEAFPDHEGDAFQLVSLKDLNQIERQTYVEKHLISPALASNHPKAHFFMDTSRHRSIMVNEEDHIRIQCTMAGLQLDEAWNEADQLDNWLGKTLTYAFDETYGYLTACPTNVGTGIRVSVMMHLPALTMLGYISDLINAAGHLGFAVRGVFGEGSEYMGNLYQISNQNTLGPKEQEIVDNLKVITYQVMQKERLARKNLLTSRKIELDDKIHRSMGILKYARRLTRKEAMQYLSDLKLGVTLGLINSCSLEQLQDLIEQIQPANIQKKEGSLLKEIDRDVRRAELIRSNLSQKGGNMDVHE